MTMRRVKNMTVVSVPQQQAGLVRYEMINQTPLLLSDPRNGHLRQTKPEKKFI